MLVTKSTMSFGLTSLIAIAFAPSGFAQTLVPDQSYNPTANITLSAFWGKGILMPVGPRLL
jgi:hypothetical protein